jgi:hypothetical protein
MTHTPKKPLCEQAGHIWQRTAAENYRVCTRTGCTTAQRLHYGAWVTVPTTAQRTQHAVHEQTPVLWEGVV